jgi:hypothetical protein
VAFRGIVRYRGPVSHRAIRWAIFITAIGVLPLPFFLAQTGSVPPLRMLMLAAISLAVIAVEGAQGAVGIGVALLLAQAAAYLALLWIGAGIAVRGVAWLPQRLAAAVVLVVLLAAITFAVGFDIYRDPFRAHALRINLVHVYD